MVANVAQLSCGRFLDKVVNPYLNLFRRGPLARLAYSTGIDVSPIIALFILYFVQNYVLIWILIFIEASRLMERRQASKFYPHFNQEERPVIDYFTGLLIS